MRVESVKEKLFRSAGLMAGVVFIALHVIRGLHYDPHLLLSPWLHVLALPAELFVIVIAWMLLRVNKLKPEIDGENEEEEERGIDFMVKYRLIMINS